MYRYYCKNPACPYKTFTNLPPGLVPYSRHSLDVHILAVQGYAWGRSAYRLVGQAMGVSTATAYRWVSAHVLYGQYRAWGEEHLSCTLCPWAKGPRATSTGLLPVAAPFGVVRSSGVGGGG